MVTNKLSKSLFELYPEAEDYWDYDKNTEDPSHLSVKSQKSVFWRCKEGHSWKSRVCKFTSGQRCPYCAAKKVLSGYNDLLSKNPLFMKEWDYDKNNSLDPAKIYYNSNLKVWWKCVKGHSWLAKISSRFKSGCPYCQGKLVSEENCLATKYPSIATEWDFAKNIGSPKDYTAHSGKKFWWICRTCGNNWQATINKRTNGRGCPICAKEKRKSRYFTKKDDNVLSKEVPDSLTYWDYDKNSLSPDYYSPFSNKKVWWKCPKKHEFSTEISKFTKGQRCPVCTGKKIVQGINDIFTLVPKLKQEWDFEKNIKISPYNLSINSGRKVWWKCKKGHSWQAVIQTRRFTKCPYCANRLASRENNLAVLYLDIAKDWNYEKNNGKSPEEFVAASGAKVWWKCKNCGYEWKAQISSRTSKNTNCPICSRKYETSFPEQTILFYLEQIIDVQSRKLLFGFESDIFIPELHLAIEYNGVFFHNKPETIIRDLKKKAKFSENKIDLIVVEETKEELNQIELKNNVINYKPTRSYDNLKEVIENLIKYISTKTGKSYIIDIDVRRDHNIIFARYANNKIKNSFANKYPDKIIYWDDKLNGNLQPSMVLAGANYAVYWKCPRCGKSWKASPRSFSRTKKCPLCKKDLYLKS